MAPHLLNGGCSEAWPRSFQPAAQDEKSYPPPWPTELRPQQTQSTKTLSTGKKRCSTESYTLGAQENIRTIFFNFLFNVRSIRELNHVMSHSRTIHPNWS